MKGKGYIRTQTFTQNKITAGKRFFLGCLPFSRKNRLVESGSKWDASKPRMEISMGCVCSISTVCIRPGGDPPGRIQTEVSGTGRKSKWNAHFPFGYSGWAFWTTSEDVPFISEIFRSGKPK